MAEVRSPNLSVHPSSAIRGMLEMHASGISGEPSGTNSSQVGHFFPSLFGLLLGENDNFQTDLGLCVGRQHRSGRAVMLGAERRALIEFHTRPQILYLLDVCLFTVRFLYLLVL